MCDGMKRNRLKLFTALTIALIFGLFLNFELQQYLTLDYLESRHTFYQQYYEQNQLWTIGIYFTILFLLTSLSIPGITAIVIAGGALFGFPLTLLITSFADAFGSTAAFLASRYLFGNSLQAKNKKRMQIINKGVDKDGAFYLFSLRLMPFFPCFLINLLMGMTSMRITTFYWVTLGGKLPFTAIYVNAGTQLGKMDSVFDIFSPGIVLSFVLIGVFPLAARKSLQWLKTHKKMGFHKN